MELAPEPARFELDLELRNDMVTTVRKFIERLYSKLLDNDEVAYRVGLTAHELMENAIKCATIDQVFVSVEMIDGAIHIGTRNRARPSDIAILKQHLSEMSAARDPFDYYQQLMRRSLSFQDASGLGLGRIWAEADMSLSCKTESDMVYVYAQTNLPGGTA